MLFMSKQSDLPSSDFLSAALMRFNRSWRSRSMLTRSSQSTAIRPKVFKPIANLPVSGFEFKVSSGTRNQKPGTRNSYSSLSAQLFRHLRHRFRRRHGLVFEHWREWHRHIHGAHALYRRVEIIKSAVGNYRGDLGGDAIALVAFVDDNGAASFLRRFNNRLLIKRRGGSDIDDFRAD